MVIIIVIEKLVVFCVLKFSKVLKKIVFSGEFLFFVLMLGNDELCSLVEVINKIFEVLENF